MSDEAPETRMIELAPPRKRGDHVAQGPRIQQPSLDDFFQHPRLC